MESFSISLYILFMLCSLGWTAQPSVDCPAPVSPTNGQVYLQPSGAVVKYTCDPGYILSGLNYASCIAAIWVPEPPTCQPKGESPSESDEKTNDIDVINRPLFKWDENEPKWTGADEPVNTMQSDDAFRVVMYPYGRHVTRLQRMRPESEDDEKKRKPQKEIYIRRSPETNEKNGISIVEKDGVVQEGKGVQSDEALRYMYYLAHYTDPRYAEAYSRSVGYPYGYTLSESQMAWINSLHPEVRDKYLQDLYNVRVVDDVGRPLSYLRSSSDPAHYYHYYYNHPYYYSSQRLASVVEDSVAAYDYSCYQTEDDGSITKIRAPALRNAHVHRYDRRQNPNYPNNNYLSAVYRCNFGYTLLDNRVKEMHCSKRRWTGATPTCVPRF